MIDLHEISRAQLAAGPAKLSAVIKESRRQILREFSDADADHRLADALFWPTIRALGNIGAKPILTADEKSGLAELAGESFAHWRAGEPAAREAWLDVKWKSFPK